MGFCLHIFFPTALDKLLNQGEEEEKERQNMVRMYSTEFTKKIAVSKVKKELMEVVSCLKDLIPSSGIL